jgi:amidase
MVPPRPWPAGWSISRSDPTAVARSASQRATAGSFGIRPTHGRVSLRGAIPFGPSFDVAGWFAREPEVFRRVGEVLLDDQKVSCRLRRLLVASDAFDLVEPGGQEELRAAVDRCAAHFSERVEVIVSADGLPAWFETFRILQAAEIWANHGEWVMRTKPKLGLGIKGRFAWAARVSADQVGAAKARQEAISQHLERTIEPGDALCLPTSPRIAPLKNTPTDKIEIEFRQQAMCLLCISGLGGLPQVSLPLVEIADAPLGLSLVGARGTDEALLGFASAIFLGV